ncbi:MAG: phospho-sugar mutase [Gemmataceae bacterium]|nr:phospho-sugar mutase [Gemmataceae bacterium]
MDPLALATQGFAAVQAEPALKEQAVKYLRQWLTGPAVAAYRPQLEWLIQTEQWTGLLDRFYQILPFGTGGRRGAVGIGPNRMNLWTLGASVQGHCEYLKESFPGIESLHVVVAYDVRQFEDRRKNYNPDLPNPVLHLRSKDFAQYAVGVYVANGIHAHILPEDSPRYLATPELSFAIRQLKAHGGLNISASHNPPDDNGGKFYDDRGGQPIAPDDQIMADLVEQVTTIRHLPWADAVRTGRVHFLAEAVHDGYIDLCRRQSLVPPPRGDEVRIVFTPLHGVGSMTAMEVLVKQGFRVLPVEEQMRPDGQFPNVTQTPNPEVPASMDRAEALARKEHADLVLATDPDADRIGAMAAVNTGRRGPAGDDWPMQLLNGNTLAALVTHFKLEKLAERGEMPPSPIVVRTLVTTGLVTRIARHFGAQVIENLLVGFKYVADVLWQLEQHGAYEDVRGTPEDFVIASEESHGILVTPHIRDKDAGGAALLLAEMALDLRRRGWSVLDYLDEIERRFGYFRTELHTITMTGIEGKQRMARMLDRLRAEPPREIGGLKVTQVEDLRREDSWLGPIKGATDAAARNFLIWRFGDRGRVALRPSGTEPKAKAYVEACSAPCRPGTPSAEWEQIRRETDEAARRLTVEFVRTALATADAG